MFINAVEILLAKKKGNMDKLSNQNFGKRGWSFQPFMPGAYYIDLVWQAAVRFDFYEDFCDYIAGGFIERFDSTSKQTHSSYTQMYEKYISKGKIPYLNPCHLFWPILTNFNDFALEFSSSHILDQNQLLILKRFIHVNLIHNK